jgi:Immunity protein 61
MASPLLSADLIAWAQAAGYTHTGDEHTVELRPLNGANTRYHIRSHSDRRLVLTRTEPDADHDEHTVLLIATPKVVEHHMYSLFGDDIRDDLDLPYLQLAWAADDLAPGYTLTTDGDGLQVLVHHRLGAVAAAPDPTLGMLTLVPLSRLLGHSAADLRRAFMAEDGAPLLSNGYYATRQA